MKITLITVGKIKEKYLREAIDEYSKRLRRYCTLSIIECADEAVKENASEAAAAGALAAEGERILQKIPANAYVTALAIKGMQYDSVSLAGHIQQCMTSGSSHLVYIIGGSWGLDARVLSRCDEQLSFSALTFPHQLMRVILLEQLYRSFRIINHEPYHK